MTYKRENEISDGLGRKPTITEIEEKLNGQYKCAEEQLKNYNGHHELGFNYWLGYMNACQVAIGLLSERRFHRHDLKRNKK